MASVEHYIRRDMRHVRGWLNTLTAQIIAALGEHQKACGVTGALGEIGVDQHVRPFHRHL